MVETGITVEFSIIYEGLQIMYSVSSNPLLFDDWVEVKLPTRIEKTLRISCVLPFQEGINNFIQWRLKLNASTIITSGPYRISVDISPPYFGTPLPDLNLTLVGNAVSISVPVIDNGSGIDSTSIEYQLSSSPIFGVGEWRTMESLELDGKLIGMATISGLTGKNNYIRFRARDMVGNPHSISKGYRIMFNEPPLLQFLSPENNTHFEKGVPVIFNASILDPDPLDAIVVWWISDIDGPLGQGPMLTIWNLSIGTHQITLQISDGGGHQVERIFVVHIEPLDEPTSKVSIFNNWGLILLIIIAVILVTIIVVLFRIKHL
jgi:hypothetical protein